MQHRPLVFALTALTLVAVAPAVGARADRAPRLAIVSGGATERPAPQDVSRGTLLGLPTALRAEHAPSARR